MAAPGKGWQAVVASMAMVDTFIKAMDVDEKALEANLQVVRGRLDTHVASLLKVKGEKSVFTRWVPPFLLIKLDDLPYTSDADLAMLLHVLRSPPLNYRDVKIVSVKDARDQSGFPLPHVTYQALVLGFTIAPVFYKKPGEYNEAWCQ